MPRPCLFFLFGLVVLLAGCATSLPVERAKYVLSDFEPPGAAHPLHVSDPFGPVNRRLYRFNYYLDDYLLLPVVHGYELVTPDYVEERVSNFFDNLGEIANFTNALLQLKPKSAGITLGRILINSSVGIVGLWDPAAGLSLQRQDEDLGQTLGYYGFSTGPYLVVPALGPSNLRDLTGLVGDGAAFTAIDPLNFTHNDGKVPYQITKAVEARHRQPFRYYTSGSPFEYGIVRLLYTEKRKLQIAK